MRKDFLSFPGLWRRGREFLEKRLRLGERWHRAVRRKEMDLLLLGIVFLTLALVRLGDRSTQLKAGFHPPRSASQVGREAFSSLPAQKGFREEARGSRPESRSSAGASNGGGPGKTDQREPRSERTTFEPDRLERPVSGKILRSFGWGRTAATWRYHPGVDLEAAYQAPIYPAYAGVVKEIGSEPGLGQVVRLAHGQGWETIYGHCAMLAVREGQRVERGTVIAYAGQSGDTLVTAVHFGLFREGKPYDPTPFLHAVAVSAPRRP